MEVDFKVMNKEISEPLHLEVGGIILKFKDQKAPGIHGIMAEILQTVGQGLCRRIRGSIKIICHKEEMPIDWKMGTVCPKYKKR
jgi:hypothetical protein